MALEEYRAKRDFERTPEPSPEAGLAHRRPIFVVQEHHARRLHYDFRLEVDGVLKSWAVPKEPSLDPADKRLAVRVEDHPLSYAGFHGVIPEGQYGAGTVSIWDHGAYDYRPAAPPGPRTVVEAIESGRLEFELHGEKLKGRFALVRMKGKGKGKENWLLIKMKDEQARPAESAAPAPRKKEGKQTATAPAATPERGGSPPAPNEVPFTHADRVLFPELGITKGDVLNFYWQMAPRLLPYLRDRPVTLERAPDGVGDPKNPPFYQKQAADYFPDWVTCVSLPTEKGKTVRYALVNDVQTLLYLVNQGTITFHVWSSRVGDLDRPDFVLFDLDPGAASFADVVAVARELHGLLKGEGSEVYVKTTGKSGLHLLTPWEAGDFDEARAWAEGVARRVVEALPGQATLERRKEKRGARVYVDVVQNARGHHAVPPYVLRTTPWAGVSAPITWRDVKPGLDPGQYNLRTVFRRLSRRKRDPMAPLLHRIDRVTRSRRD